MKTAQLARSIKSFVKGRLPRGVNLGPAVVQLFLNDGRQTHLSLLNFPAFLTPRNAGDYFYKVEVYDAEGRALGRTRIELSRFGAVDVNLSEVFDGLPPFGMVAARIVPRSVTYMGDRHLGRIRPQFFVLYAGANMQSLGLVHPQTNLGARSDPDRYWVSNLQLEPSRVHTLEVFQINPSGESLASEAFLRDADGKVLAQSRCEVPARGTRRIAFDFAPLKDHDRAISVGLQGLAAANGKPILFLHFHDGSFTCCHG